MSRATSRNSQVLSEKSTESWVSVFAKVERGTSQVQFEQTANSLTGYKRKMMHGELHLK
jgi:hypothetical protein